MDDSKNIIYRPIQRSDNLALAKVIRNTFVEFGADYHKGTVFSDPTTDHLFEYFDTPNALGWVAVESGKVLGCGGIYPTRGLPEGCIELVKLYLAAEGRSRGIGRTLFQKCLQSAKASNYKSIYIESLPEFNKAVKIYEKSGFRHLDQPLGESGHYGCNIWMIKELK